jgi:hypothetical protein
MRARHGFTVIEALAVLLLLLLVLQLGWMVTSAVARAATELADRGESLAAIRATAWILQEELDGVRAAVDVSEPQGDSFSLRAFRGTAVVCSAPAPGELVVRWSGFRSPDASKDSVLVLGGDGSWSVRALASRSVAPGACGGPASGAEERWELDRPVDEPRLARLFERGSYHLADDAFRYRIGAGGRQPLTPPNLDPASSLVSTSPSGVLVQVETRGAHRRGAGPSLRRVFLLSGRW